MAPSMGEQHHGLTPLFELETYSTGANLKTSWL